MGPVVDEETDQAQCFQLIDESYEARAGEIDERSHRLLSLATSSATDAELLDSLIDHYLLGEHGNEIRALVRQTAILATDFAPDSGEELGRSRLGGLPDMPEHLDWPTSGTGVPFVFAGQFNLGELFANKPNPLPTINAGMLWLFFAEDQSGTYGPGATLLGNWGEAGSHPGFEIENVAQALTMHKDNASPLHRRTTTGFIYERRLTVRSTTVLSLPSSPQEPVIEALNWDDQIWDRFEQLQQDQFDLQLKRHTGRLDCCNYFEDHCLVGGYGRYPQNYWQQEASEYLLCQLRMPDDGNAVVTTLLGDHIALEQGEIRLTRGEVQHD